MNDVPRAVVALAGARDGFQLPLALREGDLLDRLITDVYWPADRRWFRRTIGSLIPESWLTARFCAGLDSASVALSAGALGTAALMKAIPGLDLHRRKDRALGREAKRLAVQHRATLFCYSYYAGEAFRSAPDSIRQRFIFQLHPHPLSVRNLLQEELKRVPLARASLSQEHEIALKGKDFDELAMEPHLANGWVAASSYTAQTLAEQGIERNRIHVIPYGIDAQQFPLRSTAPDLNGTYTVMFLGSLSQRKGLWYLFEAVRLLKTCHIRLLLRGRGIVDRELLAHYVDVPYDLQINLSADDIVCDLQASDVFVLPSLAEGFAHVILQAMSCGVPVITTPHTCGTDVIEDGRNGFIIPIRDAHALAEKIQWGLDHRSELAELGRAAADRAREFTWERFRSGIRAAYLKMLAAV